MRPRALCECDGHRSCDPDVQSGSRRWLWGNPANWEEGIAPVNGDDLVFPHGNVPSDLTNTIASLQVRSLAMVVVRTISGQPFSIGEGGMKWAGTGNTALVTINVPVTLLADQTWQMSEIFVTVAASTRFTLPVNGSEVPGITNERFGVLIESNQPIAVERALYWDADGTTWAAGSNATASRLP